MKPIYERNPFVDRFLALYRKMKLVNVSKESKIVLVKSKIVIVKAVF